MLPVVSGRTAGASRARTRAAPRTTVPTATRSASSSARIPWPTSATAATPPTRPNSWPARSDRRSLVDPRPRPPPGPDRWARADSRRSAVNSPPRWNVICGMNLERRSFLHLAGVTTDGPAGQGCGDVIASQLVEFPQEPVQPRAWSAIDSGTATTACAFTGTSAQEGGRKTPTLCPCSCAFSASVAARPGYLAARAAKHGKSQGTNSSPSAAERMSGRHESGP